MNLSFHAELGGATGSSIDLMWLYNYAGLMHLRLQTTKFAHSKFGRICVRPSR